MAQISAIDAQYLWVWRRKKFMHVSKLEQGREEGNRLYLIADIQAAIARRRAMLGDERDKNTARLQAVFSAFTRGAANGNAIALSTPCQSHHPLQVCSGPKKNGRLIMRWS